MTKPKTARMSYRELSAFCRQLAMLIEGGLTVEEGTEAIKNACASAKNASVYIRLHEAVSERGVLSEALSKDGAWPKYLTEMIAVGENTGRLDEILLSLEAHYEREERLTRAMHNAAAYPMVLGGMIFVIIAVMLRMVMPVFYRVLEGMGLASGGLSGGLFQTGQVLGWTVLAIVGVFLLIAFAAHVLLHTGARKKVYSVFKKLCPAIRRIIVSMEASRTSAVVSMMLKSGFTPEYALEAAGRVSQDDHIKEKIKQMEKRIGSGASLSEAMAEAGLLNEIDCSMLRMAENVGKADAALDKISTRCEEAAEAGVESFVSVIEPTLVSVLSVVVGAMLLSVMLPMAGVLAGVI